MITIEELVFEILSEKALYEFDSKTLVNWAVKVMLMGFESENIFVLAGLDNSDTEEREIYFFKSLTDLNIKIDKSEEELIEIYAIAIAKKALAKQINLDYALTQMQKILSFTNYSSKYIPFYEIKEDLERLKYSTYTIYNSEITLENYNDFLLEEFGIFLEMEEIKLPDEERKKCLCLNCIKLNIPIAENNTWVCEFCNSSEIMFNNNHKVKRFIIDEYKTKTSL